jgi:hypothetical protein
MVIDYARKSQKLPQKRRLWIFVLIGVATVALLGSLLFKNAHHSKAVKTATITQKKPSVTPKKLAKKQGFDFYTLLPKMKVNITLPQQSKP